MTRHRVYIEPLSSLQRSDRCWRAGQLLEIWRETNGTPCRAYAEHSNHLLLADKTTCRGDTPVFFMIGKEAFARKVFGEAWAAEAGKAKSKLSFQYRNNVAGGYYAAQTSLRPQLEAIETTLSSKDTSVFKTYSRLILPLQAQSGVIQHLVYCHEL